MDSGSTGISVRLFATILGVTVAGLFAIMYYGFPVIWSSLGLLVLSVFILGSAAGIVIHDGKTTTIEWRREEIVLQRPFFSPVILGKDEIESIGVRENIHHSHRLFLRVSMIILIAGFILTLLPLLSEYPSLLAAPASSTVFFVYYLAVIAFAALLFFRGYIRSRYPRVLAIQTKNQKVFGLYVSDPEMMTNLLLGWRA